MAYSAITFSGSTNGRPMAIDAVASPGTTIHTVATATAAIEDIFIDAWNTATADRDIWIELGATGDSDALRTTLPPRAGPYRIVAGARLAGGSGIVVRAYATATGNVRLAGGVNRIL